MNKLIFENCVLTKICKLVVAGYASRVYEVISISGVNGSHNYDNGRSIIDEFVIILNDIE